MGRRVTIRYSLARNLMLMILLTSGGILVVGYLSSSRIVRRLSQELISQKLDRTEQELQKFFMPVHNGLILFREWGRAGLLERLEPNSIGAPLASGDALNTSSIETLNRRFVPLLEHFPQVSSMMVSTSDGEEYMLLRLEDHWLTRVTEVELWGGPTLWMRRENDGTYGSPYWEKLEYDPRVRPWFRGALDAPNDDVHWTEPYKFFTTKDPGITASVRWEAPGDDSKTFVMAFDVMLRDISHFTMSQRITARGKVLVVTDDGALLGLPQHEKLDSPDAIKANVLSRVDDLEIEPLTAAALTWRANRETGEGPFPFTSGDEGWWVGARRFEVGDRRLWVAVVVPEGDFLADVIRQRNTVVGITVGALFVAFVVAVVLARRYSKPLAALAAQASRIQRLDLRHDERIESDLREVEELASNQDQMMTALRSFSRYVPFELVRELLRIGEVATIGGRSAKLTVLFSDIQGFTAVAERMTPEGLTAHLSEYFEMMVDTLQGERATVDKMVGDAIIAFWGAPLPDAEHAKNAVCGVARCRERLADLNARWREQGKPELPTCFGLDVGPLVVGNVGSPSRLNYTVLGDTVNLASRIEGLNRHYGTEILASESLKDAAGDDWRWRLVDAVAVKGKREAVRIYEFLGSRDDTSSERLEFARAYEQAFQAYQARQFDEAEKLLTELRLRWPGNRSVESLRALCLQFSSEPPPPEWDGVARLDSK